MVFMKKKRMKKIKTKSKLEWFKKNIVIVPVVAAIILELILMTLNKDYQQQKLLGLWQKTYIVN